MDSRATSSLPPPQSPYLPFLPPPAPSGPAGFDLNDRVSPSMFILLLILAVIFFISGVLHLLVRFLLRPPRRNPDQNDDVSAFQGQLQQLFHLHDAGVDQSFIDALPVFNYKAIIGVKDPFDCAVCLCEFEPDDKLRLLPKCSHAFHVDCIDTWLLSHSTCPLCRTSLLVDLPSLAGCSPVVLVLDSGGESSQEIISDYSNINNNNNSNINNNPIARVSSHSSEEFTRGKSIEIQSKGKENPKPADKVVSIKLGKYRNINGGGSNIVADGDNTPGPRRCFSMGSFAYVMDESSSLWVPIRTPATRQSGKKTPMPLIPGHHRPTMSECGCGPCGSWREFNNFEAFRFLEIRETEENGLDTKNESLSISKIWTRAGRRESSEGSRRAFSFRFPINRASDSEEMKGKGRERRALSEIDMGRWGGTSEDGDMRSRSSLDSNGHEPSFARRTLLWIMGRPSKAVGSSASSEV